MQCRMVPGNEWKEREQGKGGALSLSLLADSSHHSNGPGLMTEATTGRSALKGISAEELLAGKDLGVKFWAVSPSYNQQHCKRKETNVFFLAETASATTCWALTIPKITEKKNHTRLNIFF